MFRNSHNMSDQLSTLMAGTAQVLSEKELSDRLQLCEKEGRPLRVKLGVDPTSPDLHLGHTVVLENYANSKPLVIRQFSLLVTSLPLSVIHPEDPPPVLPFPAKKSSPMPRPTPAKLSKSSTNPKPKSSTMEIGSER